MYLPELTVSLDFSQMGTVKVRISKKRGESLYLVQVLSRHWVNFYSFS